MNPLDMQSALDVGRAQLRAEHIETTRGPVDCNCDLCQKILAGKCIEAEIYIWGDICEGIFEGLVLSGHDNPEDLRDAYAAMLLVQTRLTAIADYVKAYDPTEIEIAADTEGGK